jgi:hypothetical protein
MWELLRWLSAWLEHWGLLLLTAVIAVSTVVQAKVYLGLKRIEESRDKIRVSLLLSFAPTEVRFVNRSSFGILLKYISTEVRFQDDTGTDEPPRQLGEPFEEIVPADSIRPLGIGDALYLAAKAREGICEIRATAGYLDSSDNFKFICKIFRFKMKADGNIESSTFSDQPCPPAPTKAR